MMRTQRFKLNKISFAFALTIAFISAFTPKVSATERLLVEYNASPFETDSSRRTRNLPPQNVTNWVISKVIRNTDKICGNYRSPSVVGYVQGSFTQKNAQESLYLINIGDGCGARGIGTIRIAVGSGSQVTTYGEVAGNHRLKKITDINQDGLNEVLLEDSWLAQGNLTVWNKLLEVRPKGILTLGKFVVYFSNDGRLHRDDGNYRLLYEAGAKVYYALGQNNQIASLRSDWIIRGCGPGLSNTADGCSEFQPLLSYDIPLYTTGIDREFNEKFFTFFDRWFARICRNVCETW